MIQEIRILENENFTISDRVVFFDYKTAVSEMFLMRAYVIRGGDLLKDKSLKTIIGSFVKFKVSFGDPSEIGQRFFSGIISSASYVVLGGDKTLDINQKVVLKLEIRPVLYLLKYTNNYRSFPQQTINKVIQAIFKDFQESYQNFLFEEKYVKSDEFLERLNTNQIGESDFDFIMRLMHSEGISFYFTQEEEGHKIILTDNIISHFKSIREEKPKTYYLVEPASPYKLFSGYKSFFPPSLVMASKVDSVFVNYHHDMQLTLQGYELTGWDFRDSQNLLQSALTVSNEDSKLATVDKKNLQVKAYQQSLQNTTSPKISDAIQKKQSLIHSLSEYTDANIISGQSSLTKSYFPQIGDYIQAECTTEYVDSHDLSAFMDKGEQHYLCDIFYVYQEPSFFDKLHGTSLYRQLFIFDFQAINSEGQFIKLPEIKALINPPDIISAKIYGKEKIHVFNDKDLLVKIMFPWHADFNNPTDGKSTDEESTDSKESSSGLDAKGESYCWAWITQPYVGTEGDDSGSQVLPKAQNSVAVVAKDKYYEMPHIIGCIYNSRERPPFSLTDSEELGDIKVCFPPKSSGSDEQSDSDKSLVGQAKLSRVEKDDNFTFKGNNFIQEFDKKIDIVTNELSITVGNKDEECVMITVTPKGFILSQKGNDLSVVIKDEQPEPNSLTLGKSFSSVCQGDHTVDAKGNVTQTTPKNVTIDSDNLDLDYKSKFSGSGKTVDLGYTGGSIKGG